MLAKFLALDKALSANNLSASASLLKTLLVSTVIASALSAQSPFATSTPTYAERGYFIGKYSDLYFAGDVTLTDKQGRELICKIVSKSDSLVTVSDTRGRDLNIDLDLLDEKSVQLVQDWIHPSKALFQILNSHGTRIELPKYGHVDYDLEKRRMDFAKEYGVYSEFGNKGDPIGFISFASLIFSISERNSDQICGNILYQTYHSGLTELRDMGKGNSIRRGSMDSIQEILHASTELLSSESTKYIAEDLRNLQRAILEYRLEMQKRSAKNSFETPNFFISQDVFRYSKRIAKYISPHRSLIHEIPIQLK